MTSSGWGGFNTDFWDCQFAPHLLIWILIASWKNAGADDQNVSNIKWCDLNKGADCERYLQDP